MVAISPVLGSRNLDSLGKCRQSAQAQAQALSLSLSLSQGAPSSLPGPATQTCSTTGPPAQQARCVTAAPAAAAPPLWPPPAPLPQRRTQTGARACRAGRPAPARALQLSACSLAAMRDRSRTAPRPTLTKFHSTSLTASAAERPGKLCFRKVKTGLAPGPLTSTCAQCEADWFGSHRTHAEACCTSPGAALQATGIRAWQQPGGLAADGTLSMLARQP